MKDRDDLDALLTGAAPDVPSIAPTHAFNIEAEQALLGAILFDNEIYYKLDKLRAEHFYDPRHRKIFSHTAAMIDAGQSATPVTLKTFLDTEPGIATAGSHSYLEALLENVPTLSGALDYARLVFDLSVYRGLAQVGAEIAERAARISLGDDPAIQIEAAERALYGLGETGRYGGGFKHFNSVFSETLRLAEAAKKSGGGISGLATGFIDLDQKLGGLQKSDLIIIAGRPSMGKTALATNIAVNAARSGRFDPATKQTGQPAVVGFFSLEMSAEQIVTRIIAEHAEISADRIRRGALGDQDFLRLTEAGKSLDQLSLHIDDAGGLTIAQLAARARRLKRQVGLDLLVVDYLQLLSAQMRSNDNRVQEVTAITIRLKALAKELDIPVIALSQLSRRVEDRDDKKPQLSDLRESGSIEQDADVVLFVFREEYYLLREEPAEGTPKHAQWQEDMARLHGIAELIIGKQRHGPIGTIRLAFDSALTSFASLAKPSVQQDT